MTRKSFNRSILKAIAGYYQKRTNMIKKRKPESENGIRPKFVCGVAEHFHTTRSLDVFLSFSL